ncbi:MAG: TIGR03086 family metal-binding protein [Dehalococcoidia bacterium]
MSSPKLIALASAATTEVMVGLRKDQMSLPTSCDNFDVRSLVIHMAGVFDSSAKAAKKIQAAPPVQPEDLLGEHPGSALKNLSAKMASEWDTPDSFEGRTFFGTREMSAYMAGNISFFETLIHTWDLAAATGQTLDLPEDLAEAALIAAQRICGDRAREVGAFGPEVLAPPDADGFERALALSGRNPH